MKIVLSVVAVIGGILYLAVHSGHHGLPSSSATATVPAARARIAVLRGASSDNSCTENAGDARIYVTITLRNSGGAAGTVNPWAAFDYSDGGNSEETYLENYGHDLTVPAHTEIDATFSHTVQPAAALADPVLGLRRP